MSCGTCSRASVLKSGRSPSSPLTPARDLVLSLHSCSVSWGQLPVRFAPCRPDSSLYYHRHKLSRLPSDLANRACQWGELPLVALTKMVVDPTRCDLLSPLLARARGKIDVLIFNPPYVPTEEDE
jgi:hypothetical protein